MTNTNIIITEKATIKAEGKLSSNRCKPVICIETGEVFTSMTDAAERNGVTLQTMSHHINHGSKKCNGKHFCYLSKATENLDAITSRLRETSAMEEDARKWREYQAEQERTRKAEEAKWATLEKAKAKLEKQREKLERMEARIQEETAKFMAIEREIAELNGEAIA